jgi:site-specific DNA recombinase
MTQKAQAGGTVGKAPLGYRNARRLDELGRELRYVEIDETRAELVRWAFDTYARGEHSVAMLLEELTDRGLTSRPTPKRPAKPLTISGLHRLLRNPYYLGEVVYRGVRNGGRHEALVDASTWQVVQDVLSSHQSAGDRWRQHDHYLKGSVFCGSCSSRLLVTYATNRWGAVYPYFVCAGRHRRRTDCTRKAVLIETVEARIVDAYRWQSLTPREAADTKALLTAELEKLHTEAEADIRTLKIDRTRLRDEQAKLLQAHYAGAVPLDLLKSEQERLSRTLASVEQRLDAAQRDWDQVAVQLDHCLQLLTNCQTIYANASPTIRRQLNQALFDRIEVHEDELVTVSVSVAEPFRSILAAGSLEASFNGPSATAPAGPKSDHQKALPHAYSRGHGLNKQTLVELRGFEPLTPSMLMVIWRPNQVLATSVSRLRVPYVARDSVVWCRSVSLRRGVWESP